VTWPVSKSGGPVWDRNFDLVGHAVGVGTPGPGKLLEIASDPAIEVHIAAWSKAGELDWWVKELQEWFGRVRGADGRQRWIKAVDLRPANRLDLD
jgi:hypothetical protein